MPPDDTARLCMGCMSDRGAAAICPICGYDETAPPSVPFQLTPRSVLNDQYLVGRPLGAGGFAITYLGWDIRLARRIAIKEYMPSGMASRSVDTSQVVPHGGPVHATISTTAWNTSSTRRGWSRSSRAIPG